jgi:uncharacterized protein (DUF697 family)
MSANAATVDQATPVESPDVAKEVTPMQVIKKYTLLSAGAGLIPFPVIDMAVIGGIQFKMLQDLAGVYKIGFPHEKTKAIIGSVAGGILPMTLARGFLGSLIKGIPGLGQAVGGMTVPVFAGASTYAVGRVFEQHFASGGTFLDFDPAKTRAYYAEQFEQGKKVAVEAPPAGKKEKPAS